MTKNNRVLVLTHSLPNRYGDGGQQRIDALMRGMEASGLDADAMYFLWPQDANEVLHALPGLGDRVLQVPGEESEYVWWLHEYFLGLRAADDVALVSRVAERLPAVSVVVVDHLWGWALAQRAISASGWRGRIVYHAHNAEALARMQALGNTADKVTRATLRAIARYETSLCQAAHLAIVCSEEDRLDLERKGASATVVIPNGGNRLSPAEGAPSGRFLFVGSGWFPNYEGFTRLVLGALPLMRTAVGIDVVGGAAELLVDAVEVSRARWSVAHDVRLHGRVDQTVLAQFYATSTAVLIPLRLGTGSCIKTAEALVNGKAAITTPHGCRGFEPYLDGVASR